MDVRVWRFAYYGTDPRLLARSCGCSNVIAVEVRRLEKALERAAAAAK